MKGCVGWLEGFWWLDDGSLSLFVCRCLPVVGIVVFGVVIVCCLWLVIY